MAFVVFRAFGRACPPILLFIVATVLSACGQSNSGSANPASVSASAVATASPAIQKIYDTSCRTCHSLPASGAPQTGDAKAWAPRIAQGRETLLNHAINGFKGMPPMGACMQCSEDEFAALIEYMSGAPLK